MDKCIGRKYTGVATKIVWLRCLYNLCLYNLARIGKSHAKE